MTGVLRALDRTNGNCYQTMSQAGDSTEEKKENVGEDNNEEAKRCDMEEESNQEEHEWPPPSIAQVSEISYAWPIPPF